MRQGQAGRRLRSWFPILNWLPGYDRSHLPRDALAGTVLAALAVPQSLGYAGIAGVPVQVGLYAVPVALLAYAAFGTSRQLILGPVSTVSVLSASLVASLHPANAQEAMTDTAAIALAAGIILVVAGLLHVGWVAEFLSKPIVTGFVLGLTILVILGELPHLLGIPAPPGDVLERISLLARNVDQVDLATAGVGIIALLLLFLGSRLAPRLPWSLIVLVGGLVASHVLDLAARGVAVVGTVPSGLPLPSVPIVPTSQLVDIVLAGGAIAFVGLAEGLSAGRLFALKGGYRLDTDKDFIAAGAGNVGCGLFGGMGVAGSLSKTAAVDRAGGTSQICGLTAAVLALAVILFFAPSLSALPVAVLSAIVIHAVWGLMDLQAIGRYLRVRRNDFIAALVAAVGVLVAGPLIGLLLAVGQSLLGLVYRSSRVDVEVLGKIHGEKAAWGGLRRHPERVPIPEILVLRLDVGLFWVNAAEVQDAILEAVGAAAGTKAVVLDLECTDQLETTSADMLSTLRDLLARGGVDLYLVRVRWPVRAVLARSGVRARLGEDHIWHSISQGVREARRQHGIGGKGHPDQDVANATDEVIIAPTLHNDGPEREAGHSTGDLRRGS